MAGKARARRVFQQSLATCAESTPTTHLPPGQTIESPTCLQRNHPPWCLATQTVLRHAGCGRQPFNSYPQIICTNFGPWESAPKRRKKENSSLKIAQEYDNKILIGCRLADPVSFLLSRSIRHRRDHRIPREEDKITDSWTTISRGESVEFSTCVDLKTRKK